MHGPMQGSGQREESERLIREIAGRIEVPL